MAVMNSKLLQIGQSNIVNPVTGTQLRNYHLVKHLPRSMDVTHLGFDDLSSTRIREVEQGDISVTLVSKEAPYTAVKLLKGIVGKVPAGILNYQSATMEGALKSSLAANQYDIVQIEGVEMYSHLQTIRNARRRPRFVVWDWHNIESELMYRYSLQAKTPFHKVYLRRTANQLKLLEREILASCDLHLVTSERERDQLSRINSAARIVTVENGVDASQFAPQFAHPVDEEMWLHRNHVIFVGTMDYHPNIDAVQYFCDEVWPQLHRRLPLAVFSIVGRNPPAKVLDLGRRPGVEVTGTVGDVRPYYKKAFAVVVPLRMGGGTRLKILEAMAAGVPVISTTLGAEGLAAHTGRHIEVADTPEDFIHYLSSLRIDLGRCQRLAEAGRELVESRYDWRFIGGQLANAYRRLLTPLPSLGFSRSIPVDFVPVSNTYGVSDR